MHMNKRSTSDQDGRLGTRSDQAVRATERHRLPHGTALLADKAACVGTLGACCLRLLLGSCWHSWGGDRGYMLALQWQARR